MLDEVLLADLADLQAGHCFLETGRDLGLKPVMQFEARLIAVKPLRAGARVGYKGAYLCERDSTLGIIAAGYGDGYTRHFRSGTPVLLNGRRVPLIGNVSMDMIAVDLGQGASDRVGDIATLWGDDLPVEYALLGADWEPWSALDSLACTANQAEKQCRRGPYP